LLLGVVAVIDVKVDAVVNPMYRLLLRDAIVGGAVSRLM
jgi:hypothetical protein